MTDTGRVITTDGITLAYYEAGDRARPTVVAVHGYPDHHSVWDGVVALLEPSHHVATYDVRGAGASDRPAGRSGYRMAQLVDDLAAVLDVVSPARPVHLLAHDWGSIQCWAAVTDPRVAARVASFTSISGPSLEHAADWLRAGLTRQPGAVARQLLHSYYVALFQLPALPEVAWRSGLVDRLMVGTGAIGRSAAAVEAHRRRTASDKINGLELYRANLLPRRGGPRPRPVDLPVQVLAPTRDSFISMAMQTQAPVPYVRNLRTRRLAGGHWIIVDRPDVIAGCVAEFIRPVE